MRPATRKTGFFRALLAPAVLALGLAAAPAGAQSPPNPNDASPQGGPVRLSVPQAGGNKQAPSKDGVKRNPNEDLTVRETTEIRVREQGVTVRESWVPSEFELYVGRLAAEGRSPPCVGEQTPAVRRFGAEMLWAGLAAPDAQDDTSNVPEDYVVGPGDELLIDIWGGVEASLRLKVARGGSITIPRVGSVQVAGVRFGEVAKLLRQRVGQNFRRFDLSVSMGELRNMRVFVTGFVSRPGQHLVPSLATLTQAIATAGGPTGIGSYRQIHLRRGGQLVETLDLYDLLLRGQLASDRRLQAGDVIHVPAVGPQVAVIGSVNNPAVFELKGSETLDDLLRMAGGLSPVASRQGATVMALGQSAPLRAVNLDTESRQSLRGGEVLRVNSLASLGLSVASTVKRVRVEGEVMRPGDYVLPAEATLRDALAAAGGATPQAFLYGAELRRESVRLQQVASYDKALRELEAEFTRAAVTRKERAGPPADGTPSNATHVRLIERLRQVQPTGRVVLQSNLQSRELPALALEDGDRLIVPTRQQPVGVFGSVMNGGSFQHIDGKPLAQYLAQAGGLARGADDASVFVLRADGSVVSNRASSEGWFAKGGAVQALLAQPGDTIYVPEELDRPRLTQELKDWAQILSQFGLGAVALRNLTK